MTSRSDRSARPFLRWCGGKRQLLTTRHGTPGALAATIPERFGRYHEPMVGGGALFFHLAAAGKLTKGAVLSDANERLARTWRGVRDRVEEVIALLDGYALGHAGDPAGFYTAMRSLVPDGNDDAVVASWLIYLNRTSFNGLYRVNRAGRFNTPFDGSPTLRVDPDGLRAAAAALAGVDIQIEDFGAAARRAAPGDLVYFDPPYVPLPGAASFDDYTPGGFGLEEHRRLRDTVAALGARGVHVLASNSGAPAVRELYSEGFVLDEVKARRAVSCDPSTRGAVVEVLIRPVVGVAVRRAS